jgi:hypothetical protein
MTPLFSHFKKLLAYWSLIGFIGSVAITLFVTPYWFLGIALFGYFLFKDTINSVQVVGPVYWITRDYEKVQRPYIGLGFMREANAPWRIGKGLQISLHKKSFQIGLCTKPEYMDEQEAELGVLGARFMDTKPTDIGNW